MFRFDGRDYTCSDLSQGDESGVHSLQGTLYDKTGYPDLNAQSYGIKVKIFRGFRDGLLFFGCSCFCGQKFRCIQLINSSCDSTPGGGIIRSSFPCIDVHTKGPVSLQIIKALTGNNKRNHFFPIIVRDSTEFPGMTPFKL